jgi:2-C-methyl-D-erythritol 4-phosphate cytidylyltransferase
VVLTGSGPDDKVKYWALVPAAGAGLRMGSATPKQYLRLGRRSVLEHALDALLACRHISGIVLVVSENDEHWPAIADRYSGRSVEPVTGGAERCHSVLNGLEYLAGKTGADDQVLVHDAARPCIRTEDIDRLIAAVDESEHGGLLGLPVADTMKRVDAEARIETTVPRERLWRALTPQLFRLALLRDALRQAIDGGRLVTDEAAAMEIAGFRPLMVRGQGDNIKITVPADLDVAAFYLQSRKSS